MDLTNAALTDYWWGTKDGKPFMEEDIIKSMEKIMREESNKKKACDLGPIIDGPRLRPRKKKKKLSGKKPSCTRDNKLLHVILVCLLQTLHEG